MRKTPRILVVGSINMDLSIQVPRLPAPGETVSGGEVVRSPGGKGANQAVAAARLGASVRLVGLVGSDPFGVELRLALEREGVDVTTIGTVRDVSTGLALIVVENGGENTVTVGAGANERLDPGALQTLVDLPQLLADADALLLQLEVPLQTCLAAATAARQADRLVMLNAAPLPARDSMQLSTLVSLADLLVVNETEAARLLGTAVDNVASAHVAARRLRELGPPNCVVTLGRHGAVAADAAGTTHVPGFAVETVDAVGAGDAFCAELAIAYAERTPLPVAVRRACAAGALATVRRGAQSALPTRAEVTQLLASNFDTEGHTYAR